METEQSPFAEETTPSSGRPAVATPAPPSGPAPTPLETEVGILRLAILAVGAALLVSSLCFNLFMYKQNNLLIMQIDYQTRTINQNEPIFEANKQKLDMLLQDLRAYAQTHSDLVPLLVKYNYASVQTQPGLFNPSTPAAPAQSR
jgi:hypothetical protein